MSEVVFRSVSKRYGTVTAVRDVSFAIADGTLVTLLGPSGCGKTTTLRMIAGLEHPSEGHILIGGHDVTRLSPASRDVSMVFQSYALFPHLNVLGNICYGLRASGVGRSQAADAARSTMKLVGLAGLENRMIGELSGGQQQRVALARAMVLEPRVLLFDEPLSNLDVKLRRQVRDDIRALQLSLKLTVVYVTHDQAEALAISDRIIVMNNGEIAQDGSPRDLYERPKDHFVAGFMGEASIVPVTVTSVSGDLATVAFANTTLKLPARGITPGQADMAIRPHAAVIDHDDRSELRGDILRAVYAGDHLEYQIQIDSVPRPIFVIDSRMDVPASVGGRVALSLNPSGLCLLASQARSSDVQDG
jgi:iron(III) transport system ATP-binding protein